MNFEQYYPMPESLGKKLAALIIAIPGNNDNDKTGKNNYNNSL